MRDTFPLLVKTDFPPIRRGRLDTLQANLGYRCNQSCLHCHVAASPKRTEEMAWETMELLLRFAERRGIATLDLTGDAPELNPHFRRLVAAARGQGHVHDCDFNQMLGLPLGESAAPVHLSALLEQNIENRIIRIADHCYGCTAGQGSSCGGALAPPPFHQISETTV